MPGHGEVVSLSVGESFFNTGVLVATCCKDARHEDGVTNVIKYVKEKIEKAKSKKRRGDTAGGRVRLTALLDYEGLGSPGARRYVDRFIERYGCADACTRRGVRVYECRSGSVEVRLVLLEEGPEEVSRRLDKRLDKLLKDPDRFKMLKEREMLAVARRVKAGRLGRGSDDFRARALCVVAREVARCLGIDEPPEC